MTKILQRPYAADQAVTTPKPMPVVLRLSPSITPLTAGARRNLPQVRHVGDAWLAERVSASPVRRKADGAGGESKPRCGVRFLERSRVLETIRDHAQDKRIYAAVAYVGEGAAGLIPVKAGDTVVVNGSRNALTTGATSVRVLRSWAESGVDVYVHGRGA